MLRDSAHVSNPLRNFIRKIFAVGYITIVFLFGCCGFTLIVIAGAELWIAIRPDPALGLIGRFNAVLECVAMLTIAVASLELGQTIMEEGVRRETDVRTATRVRRVLSRFMVVVVVALSIEALVATFQFVHDAPSNLPQAAMIAGGAAALLAAWGLFVRLNKAAEESEQSAPARDNDAASLGDAVAVTGTATVNPPG